MFFIDESDPNNRHKEASTLFEVDALLLLNKLK